MVTACRVVPGCSRRVGDGDGVPAGVSGVVRAGVAGAEGCRGATTAGGINKDGTQSTRESEAQEEGLPAATRVPLS